MPYENIIDLRPAFRAATETAAAAAMAVEISGLLRSREMDLLAEALHRVKKSTSVAEAACREVVLQHQSESLARNFTADFKLVRMAATGVFPAWEQDMRAVLENHVAQRIVQTPDMGFKALRELTDAAPPLRECLKQGISRGVLSLCHNGEAAKFRVFLRMLDAHMPELLPVVQESLMTVSRARGVAP